MGKPNAHSPAFVSLILIPSVKGFQEGLWFLEDILQRNVVGAKGSPWESGPRRS